MEARPDEPRRRLVGGSGSRRVSETGIRRLGSGTAAKKNRRPESRLY